MIIKEQHETKIILRLFIIIFVIFCTSYAIARPSWRTFLGYTVVHVGTITGYIDENGSKKDAFEGCQYGRKLIIDDQYIVVCTNYSYHYSYRPEVVVLSRGQSLKLIIDNEEFDAYQ